MNKQTCKKCGKTFEVTDTGNPWPGGKDREYIFCPYCGEGNGYRMISGFVFTSKIKEED